MGSNETLLIVIGAVAVGAGFSVVVLWLLLRGAPRREDDVELLHLRTAKAEADTRLAIAELESARLASTEAALADAIAKADGYRDAKAAAGAELATATEGLIRTERVVVELQQRLDASDKTLTNVRLELAGLRREKSTSDEAAHTSTQALKGTEEKAADLKKQLDVAMSALAEERRSAAEGKAALARMQETLTQERRQSGEKLELLVTARAEMSAQFKSLAEEVMSKHGESFTKLNRDQIDTILTPLREKLSDFEKNVRDAQLRSTEERATLAAQIRHIAETGAVMGKETKDLTEALRGKSQVQGAWGEMVLSTILEGSGLRPGEEYVLQKHLSTEEGQRLRPDVVVNLPGGQHVVVDSKVSLTAFVDACGATNDEEREEHLARHAGSVRNHIAQLGSKDYQGATGTTLSYVLMFMPTEAAFAAALRSDGSLMAFALERNVALTSPTTLMTTLRTVANVWQVERRNRNAEEIAIKAGKLYDKFVGFVSDMNAIGEGINRTRQHYENAMGKLATGKGNVVRHLEGLKEMGARTSKALPAGLLLAAEGTVTLAITTTQVTETAVTIEAAAPAPLALLVDEAAANASEAPSATRDEDD